MRKVSSVSAGILTGILILGAAGCDKLKSRDDINKGIAAFKNAKYGDAVELFKQAAALDPSNPNAQLYLATSYMSQWIPGAMSPENLAFATMAKDEFLRVLEKDPNNTTALASLASLAYNQASSLSADEKVKKFDEAADWYKKLIAADPKNKEAYYSLGVIAWAKWYPALMTARAELRMKPEDPGPVKDKKVKEELKEKYSAMVDEGIGNLQKALDLDKEYDDAMAYMNLLIRERADLVDSPDEYKKQIEVADSWVQKALDTKKLKAARTPATGGIVQDSK
ncbi:MAG TPA: tetratricopeptide repeat protein [Bryobacteraceae bacterium]|jgi:tetratricopeptide (TPR) repeat protein|nr:tetratricopeptide repeat protein [Bryobacteraceae bacterium]